MSCNHCNVKFNFFHKEMGCANCGLSFCSKCLKQKHKVPSRGSDEYNVCKLCFSKLSSNSSNINSNVVPPDIFLKRLETLENPAAPPIVVYRNNPKIQVPQSGLSNSDQKLVDRLEKLKEDGKKPPPTECELRQRLERLKGDNNYVEGPSTQTFQINAPDTRTDQEKTDMLLEQFLGERDIELSHDPQIGIESRLAVLRKDGVKPNEGPHISNLHDSSGSDEDVDKITKKIMDEVALEDKCPVTTNNNEPMEEETREEFPWCVLCNDDAKCRCLDCDGDLYCNKCNIEIHKEWGYTDHRCVPFKGS